MKIVDLKINRIHRVTAGYLLAALILLCTGLVPAPLKAVPAGKSPGRLSLSAGICVNKAQALFGQGRVREAIDLLESFMGHPAAEKKSGTRPETVSAGKSNHHYLYFLLGNYYSALSENSRINSAQKAAGCYRDAVKAWPGFLAAWLNLAKTYYEMEKYSEAARAFEQAYALSNHPRAIHLYYASVCRFQSQDHEQALVLFNALLQDHPDKVTLAWKEILVNILFALDRRKQALPYIEELAMKSRPAEQHTIQKKWQEILLYQYLSLDMDKKTLAYADRLTKNDPLEPKWWKALSHIHLKAGHQRRGLSALIIYGFLTPMTRAEKLLTADLYLSLDIPLKASGLYRQVVAQQHDPETLEKLVQAFVMAQEPDQALEWIDKGLMIKEKSAQLEPSLILMRAQLLDMQKSWDNAAKAYEQAAKHKKFKKQALAAIARINKIKAYKAATVQNSGP